MRVIAVLGSKDSGKTTTAEFLIRGLTRQGLRVAAVKHIHHEFSIDTAGKDTWRFGRAGARAVMGVAPNEVFLIKKRGSGAKTLREILKPLGVEKPDLVVLEGFHNLVGKSRRIPKILTAKNPLELRRWLQRTAPPIIAVTGTVGKKRVQGFSPSAPLVNLEKDGPLLLEAVKGLGLKARPTSPARSQAGRKRVS